MVLITDNATYHHAREIRTLGNLLKKSYVQLMFEHEVDYVDLPLCTDERLALVKNLTDDAKFQERGEYLQIPRKHRIYSK